MTFSQLTSPVVIDGIVSDEKLAELLGWQTEYPELDYKRAIDVTSKEGLVEFVRDVCAFQVLGGYIVGGVDGHGVPTGEMDGMNSKLFDEASLTPKCEKYLPQPLEVRSRVLKRNGHDVVLIFIGRHPNGYAIFHTDGVYKKKSGKDYIAFRAGDSYWRNGTRSERISQQGMEAIIERRLAEAKDTWLQDQQEIRRRERAEIEASYGTRRVAEAPLGSVNFDLDTSELTTAALELIHRGNAQVPLIRLLNEALDRARDAIERDEIETELANLLDKLTCLAATFLEYEQDEWFRRVVGTLNRIYSLPLRDETDARRFGYSTFIAPTEKAPRVWLLIIERIFGLGALAVRGEKWDAVRTLTLQLPQRIDTGYDTNWLRHALTMSSRAQQINPQISLLSLARNEVARLSCLRPDGLSADAEAIIDSLAQFDFLSNAAAIDDAGDTDSRVFYTNFARFRQDRIQPIVNRLLDEDSDIRTAIFPSSNEDLAVALAKIGEMAGSEGVRYAGFDGWRHTPVYDFLERYLPDEAA
jgi:hypothetical protein